MSIQDLKQVTVLYAEDDAQLRGSMTKTLEYFFGRVLVAEDGQSAWELYEREEVHVVLLDIRMARLNGLSLAARIRSQDRTLPIMIISSYQDIPDLMEAVRLHLIDYMVKPVMLYKLKAALGKIATNLHEIDALQTPITDTIHYNRTQKTLLTLEGEVSLSRKEVAFLELLLSQRGKLVSFEAITAWVYPNEQASNQALRNLVLRLRKKIGKDSFSCVKEMGYLLP